MILALSSQTLTLLTRELSSTCPNKMLFSQSRILLMDGIGCIPSTIRMSSGTIAWRRLTAQQIR